MKGKLNKFDIIKIYKSALLRELKSKYLCIIR